jgi:hypothetical protein
MLFYLAELVEPSRQRSWRGRLVFRKRNAQPLGNLCAYRPAMKRLDSIPSVLHVSISRLELGFVADQFFVGGKSSRPICLMFVQQATVPNQRDGTLWLHCCRVEFADSTKGGINDGLLESKYPMRRPTGAIGPIPARAPVSSLRESLNDG